MLEPFAAGCRLWGLCGEGLRQLYVSVPRLKIKTMATIHNALDECSTEHPVFYEDEVFIHLNPKIGADWKLLGKQKRGVTPEQNEKYSLDVALHSGTG